MKWIVKSTTVNILILLTFIIVVLMLTSCGVEKRLNRIVQNHPELLEKDTVKVTDTLIIEKVQHDTVIDYNAFIDTVYITKGKLSIKTVRVKDSIFIEGKCDTDTIIREIKVPYEKIVIKELTFWQKNRSWIIPLLVLIIGAGVAKKFGLL